MVGKDGTACQRRPIGTWPTTAMVAECSNSLTCGPRRWKENQTWSETATVQCTKTLAVSKDFVWEYSYSLDFYV